MKHKSYLIAVLTMVCCFGLILGCSSPTSSSGSGGSGSGGGTTHSYADASSASSAFSSGFAAAASNIGATSGPAYVTVSTSSGSSMSETFHFNNYSSGGVTMNGSLAVVVNTSTYAETINGTLSFSGSTTVSQFIYNNITFSGSAYSGTLQIKFTDGTTYTYDYGTGTFTQS